MFDVEKLKQNNELSKKIKADFDDIKGAVKTKYQTDVNNLKEVKEVIENAKLGYQVGDYLQPSQVNVHDVKDLKINWTFEGIKYIKDCVFQKEFIYIADTSKNSLMKLNTRGEKIWELENIQLEGDKIFAGEYAFALDSSSSNLIKINFDGNVIAKVEVKYPSFNGVVGEHVYFFDYNNDTYHFYDCATLEKAFVISERDLASRKFFHAGRFLFALQDFSLLKYDTKGKKISSTYDYGFKGAYRVFTDSSGEHFYVQTSSEILEIDNDLKIIARAKGRFYCEEGENLILNDPYRLATKDLVEIKTFPNSEGDYNSLDGCFYSSTRNMGKFEIYKRDSSGKQVYYYAIPSSNNATPTFMKMDENVILFNRDDYKLISLSNKGFTSYEIIK